MNNMISKRLPYDPLRKERTKSFLVHVNQLRRLHCLYVLV